MKRIIDAKLHADILKQGEEYSPYNSEREDYVFFIDLIKDYDKFEFYAKYLISFEDKYNITFHHFFSNYFAFLAAKNVGFNIDEISITNYGWFDSNICMDLVVMYEYGILNQISIYKSKKGPYYSGGYMFNTHKNGMGASPANNIYGQIYSSEEECFVATAQEYLSKFEGDKYKSKIKKFLLDIYFQKTGKLIFPFNLVPGTQLLIF